MNKQSEKKGYSGNAKDILRYLMVGVTTTIINTLAYHILARRLGIYYLTSTILAWIMAVLFAFFANKFLVFQQKDTRLDVMIREFISFIAARLATGGLDVAVMWLGVSILNQNDLMIKIISNMIVIVLNYILGKFFVFGKKQ